MRKIQREKLKNSIQALKGAAVGIAAAIDQEEEVMTGEQVYHLLNTIADQQTKLMESGATNSDDLRSRKAC